MSHRILLSIASAVLVFAAPDALASKENFQRDKPHVNLGAAEQDEEENAENKGTRVRKGMQELKNTAQDAADKDKPKPRKKDDVAEKTDKNEAARSRKKPD